MYEATGCGAGGSSMPSSASRSSITGPPSFGQETRSDARPADAAGPSGMVPETGRSRCLAGLEGLPAEALTPFVLVEAAPDPVRFADPKGVLEAGFEDRAAGADGLGLNLASGLLLALLEVAGREEQGRVLAPAISVELPAPGPAGAHPFHHQVAPRSDAFDRSFVTGRSGDSDGLLDPGNRKGIATDVGGRAGSGLPRPRSAGPAPGRSGAPARP